MRECLSTVLLALLLCAGPVRAQDAAEAPTAAAPPAPVVTEDDSDRDESAEPPGPPGYQEVQSQTVVLCDEGDLRATLTNGVLRPARGYVPMSVTLRNTGATPRTVRISFESTVGGVSESIRDVEVGPRQVLVAWMPVHVALRGGTVRLRSPGVSFKPYSFYALEGEGLPVLVLGSERAFQSGTSLPRVEKQPKLSVRFVPLEDAPRDLAAYLGYALVVVAGEVTSVPADVWSALEAHAATGGRLVLLHPPRDVGGRLPLLPETSPGTHPYGFGQVRLCGKAETCGAELLADAKALSSLPSGYVGVLSPAGPSPSWGGILRSGSHELYNGEQPLLPGVQAPVGRFLLLIVLFVLAVGPGGLALARRRGPVALLIAVPSVALVTCVSIIVWAVLVEGFSIHAARYSLVWLDRERDRAVVAGVGGYYANLEPEGLRVPVLGALVGPDMDWDTQAVSADWTHGMGVTGGFLPSRTYQEWGEVAVVPTRARLSVRREGQGLRVQNALGAPLAEGYVRLGGALWSLPALADGAEGEATPVKKSGGAKSFTELVSFSEPVKHRFLRVPWDTFQAPVREGTFIAKLGGPGLGPSAALPVELHEGLHFIQGRVDGP